MSKKENIATIPETIFQNKISHKWKKYYWASKETLWNHHIYFDPVMPKNSNGKYYKILLRRGEMQDARVVKCEIIDKTVWEDLCGNRYQPHIVASWREIKSRSDLKNITQKVQKLKSITIPSLESIEEVQITPEEFFDILWMARRYAVRDEENKFLFRRFYTQLIIDTDWITYEKMDVVEEVSELMGSIKKIDSNAQEILEKTNELKMKGENFLKIIHWARRYSNGSSTGTPSTFNNFYLKIIEKNEWVKKHDKLDEQCLAWPFATSSWPDGYSVPIGADRFKMEFFKGKGNEFFMYRRSFENEPSGFAESLILQKNINIKLIKEP